MADQGENLQPTGGAEMQNQGEGLSPYPQPTDQQYAPEAQQYTPDMGGYQQPPPGQQYQQPPPDQQYQQPPDQQYQQPPDQQYQQPPDQQYQQPPDQQYMPQQYMPPEGQQGAPYGANYMVPPEQSQQEAPPDAAFFFGGLMGGDVQREPSGEEDEEEEEQEVEEEAPQKPPFPIPQYVEPKMPPDLRICDKYFVKPGQWGVTPSGTLVPGTGMRPPNIPIPEGLQEDLLGFLGLNVPPKGESQFSLFQGVVDTCSIDTKEKVDDEEVSEEELMFESFDSEYLKTHLGIPLTLALAEIVAKKPTDPIHYLGHWLFKWHYNQEAREVEKEKVNELIQEREQIIAAEKEKLEQMALQLVEDIVEDVPDMIDPFELQAKGDEFGEEAIGEELSGETISEEAEQAYYADQNYYA